MHWIFLQQQIILVLYFEIVLFNIYFYFFQTINYINPTLKKGKCLTMELLQRRGVVEEPQNQMM